MRRRLAAFLCITLLLSHAAPASARRTHPTPAPTDELITAVSDPCDLTSVFSDLNTTITHLTTTAFETGREASALHHTQKSRPYSAIERNWEQILSIANPALDTLSSLPVALEASPSGAKRKAAAALIAADQKTIEHLVDFGHYAVNFERAENWQSQNFQPGTLGLGVSALLTVAAANNTIHRRFDANSLEAHEAIAALQLPQQRYAATCRVTSLASGAAAAPRITDPCELNEPLSAVRETLRQMGEEASEAGARAARLNATSRWRPYKHIEAAWSDIRLETQSIDETLSTLSVAVDPLPDTPKKLAAQNLIETDSTAVRRIFAYTQAAAGFERTQNNSSMNQKREWLSFGVSNTAAKTANDNIARQELNHVFGEPESVSYSLRLPEYHYAKLCSTSL